MKSPISRPSLPPPASVVAGEDVSAPGDLPHSAVFGRTELKLDSTRLSGKDTWTTDLPPEAQRRIAVLKGECERQLVEMDHARRSCAAEVERLNAERVESMKQRELDKRAMAAVRSFMQKQIADLDAAKAENAQLAATVESLKATVAMLEKEGCRKPATTDPSSITRKVEEQQRQLAVNECSIRELGRELVETRAALQESERELTKLREEKAAAAVLPVTEVSTTGWLGRLCRGRF